MYPARVDDSGKASSREMASAARPGRPMSSSLPDTQHFVRLEPLHVVPTSYLKERRPNLQPLLWNRVSGSGVLVPARTLQAPKFATSTSAGLLSTRHPCCITCARADSSAHPRSSAQPRGRNLYYPISLPPESRGTTSSQSSSAVHCEQGRRSYHHAIARLLMEPFWRILVNYGIMSAEQQL